MASIAALSHASEEHMREERRLLQLCERLGGALSARRLKKLPRTSARPPRLACPSRALPPAQFSRLPLRRLPSAAVLAHALALPQGSSTMATFLAAMERAASGV